MADHKHTLLAIGPYCWAIGETIPELVGKIKKGWSRYYAGPYGFKKLKIYICPVGSYVNEIGSIVFPKGIKNQCPDCKKIQ